jgi:hypothetical protein
VVGAGRFLGGAVVAVALVVDTPLRAWLTNASALVLDCAVVLLRVALGIDTSNPTKPAMHTNASSNRVSSRRGGRTRRRPERRWACLPARGPAAG